MEATAYTLATFMTDIGSMFTTAMQWVGDVATTIVSQPILLASALSALSVWASAFTSV